jgi:hypothetical protein
MCACAISAECAARRGNFEIAKEPELISQQRKVIFKKQLYHMDQHKSVLWHKKIVLYPLKTSCNIRCLHSVYNSRLYIIIPMAHSTIRTPHCLSENLNYDWT